MSNPFRADGQWLKAQFHAHSLNSDGELPAEAVALANERLAAINAAWESVRTERGIS